MTRHSTPVFAAQDYGPEQMALRIGLYMQEGSAGFVQAYRDILIAAPAAYTPIFRHLAASTPTPCLVHCTAGKDRTGVLVALLQMLVGVPQEAIADEYALTDLGVQDLKPIWVERMLKNSALEGNVERIMNSISSKRENMLATVEMIERDFGSAEGYMRKECGLEIQEVQGLRRNLGVR